MKISEIWIYPIKSCKGLQLQEHDLLSTGFRFDRQWMIVDEEGTFLTQREHPEMARIQTSLETDKVTGAESIWIQIQDTRLQLQGPSDTIVPSTVWSSKVKASLELNPLVSESVSDFLRKKVRMVTVGSEFQRPVPEREGAEGHQVFFADSHPLLLATERSLQDLNSRLKEPVPMSRFRPNLVIAGDLPPYDEDQWQMISVGDTPIEVRKMCARCPIVTIDQEQGIKTGAEPLAQLAKDRRKGRKVYFGVHALPLKEARIRAGDQVAFASERRSQIQ